MLSQNPIIDLGLRGSIIGALFGGLIGVGKGLVVRGKQKDEDNTKTLQDEAGKEGVHLDEFSSLKLDSDFYEVILQLGKYKRFDALCYEDVCKGGDHMVRMYMQLSSHQMEVRPSTSRIFQSHISRCIEGVRGLRAKVEVKVSSFDMQDFDEVAGKVQKACDDYFHNVNFTLATMQG